MDAYINVIIYRKIRHYVFPILLDSADHRVWNLSTQKHFPLVAQNEKMSGKFKVPRDFEMFQVLLE